MTAFVDGPFYCDRTLPVGEARKKLRDEVFCAMEKRAALSDYDGIVYKKREDNR